MFNFAGIRRIDQDLAKAEASLADLSRKLRELLAISYEKNRYRNAHHDSDFEVIMLRAIKPNSEPKESPIAISGAESKNIDLHVNELGMSLAELDENIRLAVLAKLVDKWLPAKEL